MRACVGLSLSFKKAFLEPPLIADFKCRQLFGGNQPVDREFIHGLNILLLAPQLEAVPSFQRPTRSIWPTLVVQNRVYRTALFKTERPLHLHPLKSVARPSLSRTQNSSLLWLNKRKTEKSQSPNRF